MGKLGDAHKLPTILSSKTDTQTDFYDEFCPKFWGLIIGVPHLTQEWSSNVIKWRMLTTIYIRKLITGQDWMSRQCKLTSITH